jgi:hypothetical protein
MLKEFLTSGLSVSAANVCTNPIGEQPASRLLPPLWPGPRALHTVPQHTVVVLACEKRGLHVSYLPLSHLRGVRMSDEDCAFLLPDVVKVRMQLHSMQMAGDGRLIAPNPNLVRLPHTLTFPFQRWAVSMQLTATVLPQVRTGVMMVQAEGWAALMSGASATVARGLFYGGDCASPRCASLCRAE